MTSYWPWWAGALGLALITINHALLTDRRLGVSGVWQRLVHWRAEREVERLDEQVDERVLLAALATTPGGGSPPTTLPTREDAGPAPSAGPRRLPLATGVALLVSIVLGGTLASVAAGRFELRLDMGEAYRTLVTGNPVLMVLVLFVGGVLVGVGTRLAGGCSSGHGLSGCGRLSPVSLLATAVFFGTAVVVSFLLVVF